MVLGLALPFRNCQINLAKDHKLIRKDIFQILWLPYSKICHFIRGKNLSHHSLVLVIWVLAILKHKSTENKLHLIKTYKYINAKK